MLGKAAPSWIWDLLRAFAKFNSRGMGGQLCTRGPDLVERLFQTVFCAVSHWLSSACLKHEV